MCDHDWKATGMLVSEMPYVKQGMSGQAVEGWRAQVEWCVKCGLLRIPVPDEKESAKELESPIR